MSGTIIGAFGAASLTLLFLFLFGDFYPLSYKKRYKRSYMTHCVGSRQSKVLESVCECSADEALKQLTAKQLEDQQFSIDYIQAKILPGCIGKYNKKAVGALSE